MAFKMKGPNFGKGTGSENPMKINSSFKKETRFGRFVKGVKEVGSAIKETFATGSTPAENRSRARAKRSEQALIEQKIRHGNFDESKLNSFQKTVYKEMKAKDKAKKEKANMEKNVAENKASGPKTQAQNKDEKRPPMAKKKDIKEGSHLSTKKKKRPQTMAEAVAEAKAINADPNTKKINEERLSRHLQADLKSKSPNRMKKDDAMKMKKDPMKMKKDDAMKMKKDDAMKMKTKDPLKKYKSDAQRKAVHASKAESGMKMKTKDPMKLNKGFDKLPKEVQAKIMKKRK